MILNYLAHFGYGTALGTPLMLAPLLSAETFFGIVAWYFPLIWLQGFLTVPLLARTPPPWQWGFTSIMLDGFHHAVYAVSVVSIYLLFT